MENGHTQAAILNVVSLAASAAAEKLARGIKEMNCYFTMLLIFYDTNSSESFVSSSARLLVIILLKISIKVHLISNGNHDSMLYIQRVSKE